MTRALESRVAAAGLSLMACLAGCGSGTLGPDNGPPGSVLTPAVVSATFHSDGGGYHATAAPGAPCDPAQWTYVITLATHHVVLTGCNFSGGDYGDLSNYSPVIVDHSLDSSAWPAVRSALANVTVAPLPGCGEDKDAWNLTIVTDTASVTYGDNFYACQKQYASYVATDGLDNLYQQLAQLP